MVCALKLLHLYLKSRSKSCKISCIQLINIKNTISINVYERVIYNEPIMCLYRHAYEIWQRHEWKLIKNLSVIDFRRRALAFMFHFKLNINLQIKSFLV